MTVVGSSEASPGHVDVLCRQSVSQTADGVNQDLPIRSAADDRLGRGPFVQALSRHLLLVPAGQSAVISLNGPWGSGKTSILNLTAEALASAPSTVVLRFNPWLFTGAEQLIGAFFRDLSAQLTEKGDKQLQKIGEALSSFGAWVTPLSGLPVVGAFVGSAGGTAGFAAKFFKQKGKALGGSIESQRDVLVRVMEKVGKRVIVLLDDIDRLRNDEVREVMRVVRLVADFPNTVYLLAFDRKRVVQALAGTEGQDGQAYLEKIVQAAFDVPVAPEVDLAKMAIEVVNRVLSGERYPCEQKDLDNVFHRVIRPLFSTARDIRRYSNALPFAFDLIGDEVYAPDLLAVEAVRAIAPEVVDLFPTSFEMLTAVTGDGATRDQGTGFRDQLEALLGAAGIHREAVRSMCIYVFPSTRTWIDNNVYGYSWQKQWRRKNRLAHPDVLQCYLEKRLKPGALPTLTIREILRSSTSESKFSAALEPLSPGDLESLLERLVIHTEEFPLDAIEGVMRVIATHASRLREERLHIGDLFGSDSALAGIIYALSERVGGKEEQAKFVLKALPTLPWSAQWLVLAMVKSGADGLLSEAEMNAESDRLALTVQNASTEFLARERRLYELLVLARARGRLSPEKTMAVLTNDECAIQILRSALGEGFRAGIHDVIGDRSFSLPWKALVELFGDSQLKNRLLALAQHPPPTDARAAQALKTAMLYVQGTHEDRE